MARKKAKSPLGARRNALAAAIRERGQSPHNIWVIRPPFEDEDVLLNSDVAMELFYFIEGEPSFVDIDYRALRTPIGEDTTDSIADREFARVTTKDGQSLKVVYSVDAAASESDDTATYRVTLSMLDKASQRTENWRRVIPCIRRIRTYPTATQERLILLGVQPGVRRTVREVLAKFANDHQAIVLGALATVLRRRELCSDLDNAPWSLNTQLWSASA